MSGEVGRFFVAINSMPGEMLAESMTVLCDDMIRDISGLTQDTECLTTEISKICSKLHTYEIPDAAAYRIQCTAFNTMFAKWDTISTRLLHMMAIIDAIRALQIDMTKPRLVTYPRTPEDFSHDKKGA